MHTTASHEIYFTIVCGWQWAFLERAMPRANKPVEQVTGLWLCHRPPLAKTASIPSYCPLLKDLRFFKRLEFNRSWFSCKKKKGKYFHFSWGQTSAPPGFSPAGWEDIGISGCASPQQPKKLCLGGLDPGSGQGIGIWGFTLCPSAPWASGAGFLQICFYSLPRILSLSE